MKRGSLQLKARDLSLLLFVFVCATILIWAWDREPLLSSFLPREGDFLALQTVRKDEKTTCGLCNARESFSSTTDADNNDFLIIPEVFTGHGDIKEEENQVELEIGPKETESGKMLYAIDEKDVENKVSNEEYNSETQRSEAMEVHNSTSTSHDQIQTCNHSKGKWVIDHRNPLYSGYNCKRWLAPMWACRLMKRKDFTFENLRWKPKDCQMEEFEGSKFLRRMHNKTLAFIGDSLGRQQFQSMMCMITEGKVRADVEDVGPEFGLKKPKGGSHPGGWAYRFTKTNTVVLFYWSVTLCEIEPLNVTDPKTQYAMHLDRPPPFLRKYLHKIDVLVLNTGHHWNRGKLNDNRWVLHVGGLPNRDRKLAPLGNAKNFTVHSIISWVNSQLPHHPGLKAFYRSISPRHFVGGEWNSGGSCNNTTPMSIGKELMQEESSDHSAGHAVVGTGVKLLDITALSRVRDEAHISRFSITAAKGFQDCLHWCLPGVPDTWNEILFTMI